MSAAASRSLSALEKLTRLRAAMARYRFDAYIIPSSDAHASEYVAARDNRRAFISGFTGSAGTAVVTQDQARLWTDGRYFLQAEKELDSSAGWQLMKDRLPETPTINQWLGSSLKADAVVGIDAAVMPLSSVLGMQKELATKGIKVDASSAKSNLVDEVWAEEQPAAPCSPAMCLPLQYTGKSAADKISAVREELTKAGCSALVVAALDEVCWLYNIRGSDVECNPVTIAYGLVHQDKAKGALLFIDEKKITSEETRRHLSEAGVTIKPYEALESELKGGSTEGKVWIDPSATNFSIYQALLSRAASTASTGEAAIHQKMSPIQLAKALKNETEAEGMRQAHIRDAAALVSFFAWLELAVTKGIDTRDGQEKPLDFPLTEFTASNVLEECFRKKGKDFVGLSFPTIAGVGPNGAIIHYRPDEATAAKITADRVFLCDSGAQYRDGTTDVTRTLHFGSPSEHEKRCFTHVLQGHVALAKARFPAGATGIALDAIARSPLWLNGLDYRHGTGHGVGAFLNVHEGPFGIATAARTSYDGGVQAGMVLSNEPGYYEDGSFGIRIENVVLARPADKSKGEVYSSFGDKPWLRFENLTVVPICRALIAKDLLSPAEVNYLNDYHREVREKVLPLVEGNAVAKAYLLRETEPLFAC